MSLRTLLLAALLIATVAPVPVAESAEPVAPDSALAAWTGGNVFPREFVRAWWVLSPDQRPPGDAIKSRVTFVSQMVDRKILAAEMLKHHYVLTPAESLHIEETRDGMIQNALFSDLMRGLPEPTDAELDMAAKWLSSLAEVGFVEFVDMEKAQSWRTRLATGTPLSALSAKIAREGSALATVDSFRVVGAEQIPDTLAKLIWSMRVGQVSEVQSFGGRPTLVIVRKFLTRPSTIKADDRAALMDYVTRKNLARARETIRVQLAQQVERTFDEDGIAVLLRAQLLVPPRSTVDSVSGMPVMRPNIPLPAIADADTGRVIARVRGRAYTIIDYLRYWSRTQPYTRPEIRERVQLEAAIDRMVLAPELVRLARAKGFDRDPQMLDALEEQRQGHLLDHFYRDQIETRVKMTDAAVRAFWQKDPAHYNDRASIDSHIILVDRKELADSLLTALRGGASFEELARQFSMDGESGARGGRIGVQYKGTQENVSLEDAMFASPVGKIGGPERTPQGWVLWRVDTATPGVERDFAQARDMVERDYKVLEADRILREWLDRLRKEKKVRIFTERMTPDLGKGGPWD